MISESRFIKLHCDMANYTVCKLWNIEAIRVRWTNKERDRQRKSMRSAV